MALVKTCPSIRVNREMDVTFSTDKAHVLCKHVYIARTDLKLWNVRGEECSSTQGNKIIKIVPKLTNRSGHLL